MSGRLRALGLLALMQVQDDAFLEIIFSISINDVTHANTEVRSGFYLFEYPPKTLNSEPYAKILQETVTVMLVTISAPAASKP